MIETYHREDRTHLWAIQRYEEANDVVQLRSIGIEISLDEIYEDIDF